MMKFFYKKRLMNKINLQIIFLFLLFNFLIGCSTLKEGLEGSKKSNNAEEFLIEKKNPLVLPPDYSKLPIPEAEDQMVDSESEFDLENILKKNTQKGKKKPKVKSSNSLEKSILEKIKVN